MDASDDNRPPSSRRKAVPTKLKIFIAFFLTEIVVMMSGQHRILLGVKLHHVSVVSQGTKSTTSNDKWWKGQAGNTTHPHMGARHPNGTLGMIVDPSPHRLHLFHEDDVDGEVIYPNGVMDVAGIEGPGGFEVLKKIRTGLSQSREFLKKQQLAIDDGKASFVSTEGNGNVTVTSRRSKVLCLVYTVYIPGDNHKNVKAQAGTWGKQCDGFIAASNFTDHSVGAIDLPHFGPEEYGNMWQKVRSMWAYAYDHYLDDYDFFHIGGDDTYVAVDNLRAYLDGPEVSRLENGHLDCIALRLRAKSKATEDLRPRPLLFGTPMMLEEWQFPAGGSGYTLNRAALDLFGKLGLPSFMSETIDSREDFFMGRFLEDNGVFVSDTTDDKNGQRYAESAQSSFQFRGVGPTQPKWLTRKFGLKFNHGIDHASDQQIGFHLKGDREMLQSMNRTVSDSIYRYFTFLQNVSSIDIRMNSSS